MVFNQAAVHKWILGRHPCRRKGDVPFPVKFEHKPPGDHVTKAAVGLNPVQFPAQYLLDDIAKMLYILFMKNWVIEFLDETVEAEFESLPAEVRAKTIHISNLIREFGLPNIGLPYIRHVQDKIWEIKALQGRSLYITATGKKLIILRCFIKKSNKLPLKELKIAIKRAGEIKNG